MNVLNKKNITYFITAIISVLLLYWFYKERAVIGDLLSPFIYAVVIAYLFNPLVKWFVTKGVPGYLGILIIYVVFLGILVILSFFIIPEVVRNIKDLINTLPDYFSIYQVRFSSFMEDFQASMWSEDIKNSITGEIQNNAQAIQNTISNMLKGTLNFIMSAFSIILNFFLALVIAFYFMKDSDKIKHAAFYFSPRKWRSELLALMKEINEVLTRFIQGQLLVAVAVGILETVGLWIAGVRYAFILGLVGGLSNLIPYFGPFIGAVPAVAIGLLDPHPVKALWAALVFVIVQQIDNAFISPRIIQDRLGLHPVTTIFVVMTGGRFFGVAGLLLAVPITAILKVIFRRVIEKIA